MNGQRDILGVSMRGWICLVLAIGMTSAILMQLPIDTQYYTILNSVLVAYVVNSRAMEGKPDEKKPAPPSTP